MMEEYKFRAQVYLAIGGVFVNLACIYSLITTKISILDIACFVLGILCWIKAIKLFLKKEDQPPSRLSGQIEKTKMRSKGKAMMLIVGIIFIALAVPVGNYFSKKLYEDAEVKIAMKELDYKNYDVKTEREEILLGEILKLTETAKGGAKIISNMAGTFVKAQMVTMGVFSLLVWFMSKRKINEKA